MMANLPKKRLGYLEPAFSNCGVDYFGFLCFYSAQLGEKMGVPVYVSHQLSNTPGNSFMGTSACVTGIERFIAKRGMPIVIWCDNGTNLVGAEIKFNEVTRHWNDYTPAALVCKGISWKFNPTSVRHQGGSWERMVRSCKRVFYNIRGNHRMTDETLNNTFCLVEQALNNRLQTPVSDDPNE